MLDLAGAGLADLDLFPLEDLGPAGLMDSDRVRHAPLQRLRSAKEKPRRGGPQTGLDVSSDVSDQTAACAASAASSSSATMLVILIIGLTAGPAVSL